MPDKQVSTLDELIEARETAREVLRELHGTLKDVKKAKQDIDRYLGASTAALVTECLNKTMDRYIEIWRTHLEHTVDHAGKTIGERFTVVAKNLELREELVMDTVKEVSRALDAIKEKEREWTIVESLAADAGSTSQTTGADSQK